MARLGDAARVTFDKKQMEARLKEWLGNHQNQRLTLQEIATGIGAPVHAVYTPLRKMIARGVVSRNELVPSGGYSYAVNGEVEVTQPALLPREIPTQPINMAGKTTNKERVLAFLRNAGNGTLVRQKDIAEGTGISEPAVSKLLASLLNAKEVSRSGPGWRQGHYWTVTDTSNPVKRAAATLQDGQIMSRQGQLLHYIDNLPEGTPFRRREAFKQCGFGSQNSLAASLNLLRRHNVISRTFDHLGREVYAIADRKMFNQFTKRPYRQTRKGEVAVKPAPHIRVTDIEDQSVLAYLRGRGSEVSLTQREIGEAVGRPQANVSYALKRLAERGQLQMLGEGRYKVLQPLNAEVTEPARGVNTRTHHVPTPARPKPTRNGQYTHQERVQQINFIKEYLAAHKGQYVKFDAIAKELGITYSVVDLRFQAMRRFGVIEKVHSNLHGAIWRVLEDQPASTQEQAEAEAQEPTQTQATTPEVGPQQRAESMSYIQISQTAVEELLRDFAWEKGQDYEDTGVALKVLHDLADFTGVKLGKEATHEEN